jgi:hypothetical protein
MNTGIDAYKKVSVETSTPEDLSMKVINSILSYIKEAQLLPLETPKYKECLLNAQMLCVGAIFSLSGNERTKANVVLTNVFDSVQSELLLVLKDGTGDLNQCKRLLSLLTEKPEYIG